MKHGKLIVCAALIPLLGLLAGCRSSSGKTSNPFAMDRQTVAPPATFSNQPSYLGQTPGGYTPQAPATVYPQGTVAPGTTGVPLPASATVPTTQGIPVTPSPYGSINGGGASTYQSGSVPLAQKAASAPAVTSDWKTAAAPATISAPDAGTPEAAIVSSTPQTAAQYMESKVGSVATVSADGRSQSVTAAPETLVVSSSQAITKISGEQVAEIPVPNEPQPLYTAW